MHPRCYLKMEGFPEPYGRLVGNSLTEAVSIQPYIGLRIPPFWVPEMFGEFHFHRI